MPDDVKRFSEINQTGFAYPGRRLKIDDVVDKAVVIQEYTIRPSKFAGRGDMAIVHAYSEELNPEEPHDITFATGSDTIRQQLEKHKPNMPYRAVIRKDPQKGYYRMS